MTRSGLLFIVILSVVSGFLGGLTAGVLLLPLPANAQKSPLLTRVVTAEEFRVVDDLGRVVASLGTEPSLLSRLNLYDRDGGLRASLSLSAVHETVGLHLYSKRQDIQSVRLQTQPDGLSNVTFFDESGSPAAALGNIYDEEAPDGRMSRPSLKFFDRRTPGQVLWRAP